MGFRIDASRSWMTPVVVALAVAGVALSWPGSTKPWWVTAPLSTWGLLVALLGATMTRDAPARTRGRLVMLVGLTYYVSVLAPLHVPMLFPLVFATSYVWVALLGHLALVWARPFLGHRTAWALIVTAYLGAIGTQIGRLVLDGDLVPRRPWWDERADRSGTSAEALGTATLAIMIAAMFAIVLIRWLQSRQAHRSVTLPTWAFVVVAAVCGFVVTVSSWSPLPREARLALTAATLNLVQLGLLAIPVLRQRLGWQMMRRLLPAPDPNLPASPGGVGDAPAAAGMFGLETALRYALHDPGLRLYPTDGPGIPPPQVGRVDWPIRWQGRTVAVLRCDEVWRRSTVEIEAILAMVGAAFEALRLQTLALQQAEEIASSRQRLVTTALGERRRIEQDLHDGAQQMLFSVLTLIDDAEHHLLEQHDTDAAGASLRRAHDRLSAAIAELRRLTRGLYPATLANNGLAAALEELRDTSPLPMTLNVADHEWDPAVEATVYFTVAECLTNAVKHSRATAVAVCVREGNGQAYVQIRDNGTGGARVEPAGGLQHLQDRVAGLGGTFTAADGPNGGSTVTASLPLHRPEIRPNVFAHFKERTS
ncbi:hypothetical protein GCM10023170_067450 [Phytohabitans houttuyneae]|uniref:histidine kinase n=1 Tax=Phytohabitans houttuyneae TaxID=1076126 RepID=A0A6V8JXN5_9ACTN|nr:hypothetical protein Phou_017030 [Phytohabitans houttuyneae]